MIEFAMS